MTDVLWSRPEFASPPRCPPPSPCSCLRMRSVMKVVHQRLRLTLQSSGAAAQPSFPFSSGESGCSTSIRCEPKRDFFTACVEGPFPPSQPEYLTLHPLGCSKLQPTAPETPCNCSSGLSIIAYTRRNWCCSKIIQGSPSEAGLTSCLHLPPS